MGRRWFIKVLSGFLAAIILILIATFAYSDPETDSLTDVVRQNAGGSFLKLPDGVVHYELAGAEDARTVVLVHGFSVPYYIWDPTGAALLQAGFRVLRYDLYGRGYSDRPDVAYDADLFDRQLLLLLSGLQISGPVDLVGLSMGGPIVITFAGRHPEKVRTLSLLDPVYGPGHKPPFHLRAPLLGEYFMGVFMAPSLPEAQREDFYHPERFPSWPDQYRVQMQYRGFRRALLSTIRTYFARDVREDYRRVGQSGRPVLLIWGKEDRTVPLARSAEILRAIPQAEFHTIEETAHLPHYERPEIVNPMLVRFLNQ